MPNATRRPCAYPGCPNLVRSGRCAKHTQPRRNPERQKLYYTKEWKELRADQLERQPFCAECARLGKRVRADVVHHKHGHTPDNRDFFKGPFESLCRACNSRFSLGEAGLK